MPITNYAAGKFMQYALAGDDGTGELPLAPYLALFHTATTNAGGGVELVGDNYSRVALDTTWFDPTDSGRGMESNVVIDSPTASADWVSIGWVAIFDDPTAGNMWFHAQLAVARTVLTDQRLTFAIGDLVFHFTAT